MESINLSNDPAWVPIPEFNRTNADVSLFFLALNAVTYNYPNTDPLFSATILENATLADGTVFSYYIADYYLRVVGCTDQFQICNPNIVGLDGEPQRCTSLSSLFSIIDSFTTIGLNDYQVATTSTILNSLIFSNMFYAVNGRGSSALQAQNTVFNLNQAARLPDNQWQIELSSWFAVSLATFQQALVEYASGPTNVVSQGGTVTSPSDKWGQALCKRQMIRNVSGYQNFSTLGVATILVIGAGLIFLGWTIDIFVGAIEKRMNRHFTRLSWISDGYLHLQRMAYEGAGYDDWENCADDIPVSRGRDEASRMVGGLDIYDVEHPKLVRAAVQAPQGYKSASKSFAASASEAPSKDGIESEPLNPS